mmetsp:Transcript_47357/g.100640  ORF Transcript_47357/g.100640 Transcript_47357/m.100640 type:complete len:82 (+) Transcript_47357:1156-1401(+)
MTSGVRSGTMTRRVAGVREGAGWKEKEDCVGHRRWGREDDRLLEMAQRCRSWNEWGLDTVGYDQWAADVVGVVQCGTEKGP